ncbi:MAG: histidine phosphatase family protein [Micrococcales bacterium]|nr:histidine phosphatase family protein [Micrococcales bacterium]
MPAKRIHLVRHGEVYNPSGVLYGRLPNFHLSDTGKLMARAAAQELKDQGFPIRAIFSSPLIRTQESAKPIEELFGLDAKTNENLIEPWNVFEGRKLSVKAVAVRPHWWWHFRNPAKPAWGESFIDIIARMQEAISEAAESVKDGDVVLVTHQLPIWVMHLHAAGEKLMHNPRKRRCSLSSITSFEFIDGKLTEVGYLEPAAKLSAIDRGAV